MRGWPRSLLGRVFALYAVTLSGVVLLGWSLFLSLQVQRQIDQAQGDAQALLRLMGPVVADNAVIGDYDAIARLLQRMASLSTVTIASFDDNSGGHLASTDPAPAAWAPAWLAAWVAQRLGQPVWPVEVGGKAYGSLRLELAAAVMAGQLWWQSLAALGLAAVGVLGGMVVIRRPLVRWLGHLDQIAAFGARLEGHRRADAGQLDGDAPIEFQRTFAALDRVAGSLQVQREQAAATLQAIDDAVFTCDAQGTVRLVNDAARQLLGLPLGALLGQPLHRLLPALPDQSLADCGRWQHQRLQWRAADGQLRVLDSNLSPVRDGEATTIGFVLACRDITEQHQRDEALRAVYAKRDHALAELRQVLEGFEATGQGDLEDIQAVSALVGRLVQRLQQHSAQLDAIFALSPDGFVAFDAAARVSYCSPGFAQLTGWRGPLPQGQSQAVLLAGLQALARWGREASDQAPPLPDWAALADGRASQLQLPRPEGPRVLALAWHRDGHGATSQMLHLRDVTRETEVDRMKSEFVTAAAHELRTPMVGIYGYAELLVTRDYPPERQKQLLSRIHGQCEVMVKLLNEMLDLARLEAKQGSDFDLQPVELGAVLAEAAHACCPPPDRAAPQLLAPAQPLWVRADASRLQRALRNVISNAYKYSPEGGEVLLRCERDAAGQRLGLVVQDHGIGMTPEQLARVGERFYRADASGAVLGTGLGMSLVQQIVGLHGGQVQWHSAPGQGSTVTLWLPAWAGPVEGPDERRTADGPSSLQPLQAVVLAS